MALESRRGIARMKYKSSSNGWLVRYRTEGENFAKHFSDLEHGSPEKSLQEAEKYFEELREVFPPPTYSEHLERMAKKTKSGVVGVGKSKDRYKDSVYHFWVASWTINGKKKSQRFSINKFGEDEAKRLAVEARKAVEPELEKIYNEQLFEYIPKGRYPKKDEVEDPWAHEGERRFVIHQASERDKKLRKFKIENFIAEHGTIFCEVCGFNFEKVYGSLGVGLIEIHHLFPICEMEANHRTTLEQLICICSNCHFVVHNGNEDENLQVMKALFR